MKRYIICVLIVQSPMLIGMDIVLTRNMSDTVKKFDSEEKIRKRVFRAVNVLKNSDSMSITSSGEFLIEQSELKCSQAYSVKRESALEKLLQEQDAKRSQHI